MRFFGNNKKYQQTLSLLDQCVDQSESVAEESRAMRKEMERFAKADEEIRKSLGLLGQGNNA